MNVTVGTLVGILAAWMALCCFCGLKGRYLWFLSALCAGLALNMLWMVFGLGAHVAEVHVWIAEASVTLYGVVAFVIGRFAGRLQRAWIDSRVDGPGI